MFRAYLSFWSFKLIESTLNFYERNMEKITKINDLIQLVRKIIAAEGSEEEIDNMLDILERSVPDPYVSDLIFYPPEGKDLSPEEIVERALSYKPIQL